MKYHIVPSLYEHNQNSKIVLYAKRIGCIRQRVHIFKKFFVEVFWHWYTTCNYLEGVCVQTLHENPFSTLCQPWQRVNKVFFATRNILVFQKSLLSALVSKSELFEHFLKECLCVLNFGNIFFLMRNFMIFIIRY